MVKGRTEYDIAIIGAGILGLAIAMRLTEKFPSKKIIVIEKESDVAVHQTGHNSGVIHAGIYYSPGSHKANFCSEGSKLLREFADKHDIKYEMCGKVIVASNKDQVPILNDFYKRGTDNGALGLELIDRNRLNELEPHVSGVKAIWSPNTGIIDFKEVTNKYCLVMKENGGDIVFDSSVEKIDKLDGKHYIQTTSGEIVCKRLINCAGLYSDKIALMDGENIGVKIVPFRGEYWSLKPESQYLVNGLIYPLPDPRMVFLGVHFTKRINGTVEAGPNAVLGFSREAYGKLDFNVKEALDVFTFSGFWKMAFKYWKIGLYEQYRSLSKKSFVRSLQELIPEISENDLGHQGSGVRAQAIDMKGNLLQDFKIAQSKDAVHILNAPSPGASSSLAISNYVIGLVDQFID